MKCNCKIKKHCQCNKVTLDEMKLELKHCSDTERIKFLVSEIDAIEYGLIKKTKIWK